MRTTVLYTKDPSAMLDPINHARKAIASGSMTDSFDWILTTKEDRDKDSVFANLQDNPKMQCRSMAVGDVIRKDYLHCDSSGTLENKSIFWVCTPMGWTAL